MNFGCASRVDIPELRQLWMDCFGDGEDYVNQYMEHTFEPERVFVLRGEEIASMLISFPVSHIGTNVAREEKGWGRNEPGVGTGIRGSSVGRYS